MGTRRQGRSAGGPGADAAGPVERDDLGGWLSRCLGETWSVTFGRSRSAPVQARHTRRGWELRLHRMFAGAPDEVLVALARWLAAGRRARRASALLDAWIETALEAEPAPPRPARLDTQGRAHDLLQLAELAHEVEFGDDFQGDPCAPAVTWGRRARSRSRRSLRLGSFDPETHLVRIHPVLDQAAVPEWFVLYVLKHELLHAVHPPERGSDGRWIHHGAAFRHRELSWVEYDAAVAWERRNLARLIRSAREGTDLRVRGQDLALPPVIVAQAVNVAQAVVVAQALSARPRAAHRPAAAAAALACTPASPVDAQPGVAGTRPAGVAVQLELFGDPAGDQRSA